MLHGTLRQGGADTPATTENVLAALAGADFFWLDLEDVDADGEVSELLRVHFGFHPLAVQAAERFAQRPRIDEYDDFVYLVARGRRPRGQGHCRGALFLERPLRRHGAPQDCPALAVVHEGLERHPANEGASPQIVVVYRIVSSLVDSFFPYLSDFDERIDALEDDILKAPDRGPTLRALRHEARPHERTQARHAPAGHDGEHQAGVTDVPGMTDEANALLPRPLRPPDSPRRPGRQLPRSPLERHGHASIDGVQPPERGDEAADHHRHHLPAP